jgi:ABC-type transport system involved in multi-copper enzyme maturation permease subunit
LFTTGIYAIGHLTRDLRDFGAQSESEAVRFASQAMYRILPDLEGFNYTTQALHALPIPPTEVLFALLYAAGYTVVLLLMGIMVFERRDFK